MTEFSLEFPRAYGAVTASAIFRAQPEDFQVDEDLGYVPSGVGEHVFLHICKRGENTAWVAGRIAELANVNVTDIGYCGRKDRHAVTAQWFSVYLPKAPEPDWALLNTDSIQLLSASRHQTKLRRGEHQQNNFVIRLRDVQTENRAQLEIKIDAIFAAFPQLYSTPEIKIAIPELDKFGLIKKLSEIGEFANGTITTIDGLRVDYTKGWGLVRASNTSPALTLRFEAESHESLEKIQQIFKRELLKVDARLTFNLNSQD